MKFHLVIVFAAAIAAAGCTGSESAYLPGTGGNKGSGGGSGGAFGEGGTIGGSSGGALGEGGTIGAGSGGAFGGSGGARQDSGADTTPADGGADAAGGGTLSFQTDIAYVLRQSCGGCHLSQQTQGNFDMKIVDDLAPGPAAYPSVTGPVTAAHAGCVRLDASKRRVVPGKPDNSLLFIKINTGNPPAGCGKHMPDGASMTPEQIAKIRTWISQGARM